MRVAAIYDIHRNLPALEAVLQDIPQARADLVVVGGDVVPGPMVRETLECFPLMDIVLLICLIQLDKVAAWALAPYLVCRLSSLWWAYGLWRMNRRLA